MTLRFLGGPLNGQTTDIYAREFLVPVADGTPRVPRLSDPIPASAAWEMGGGRGVAPLVEPQRVAVYKADIPGWYVYSGEETR